MYASSAVRFLSSAARYLAEVCHCATHAPHTLNGFGAPTGSRFCRSPSFQIGLRISQFSNCKPRGQRLAAAMVWGGFFAKTEEHAAAEQESEEEEDQPGDGDDSGDDGEIRCRKNNESFVMMKEDDLGPGVDFTFFNVGTCPIAGCLWKKLKPHNCWSWRSENHCRSYLARHINISGQKGHGISEDEAIVIAMGAEILSKTYTYQDREAQRTKKRGGGGLAQGGRQKEAQTKFDVSGAEHAAAWGWRRVHADTARSTSAANSAAAGMASRWQHGAASASRAVSASRSPERSC